MTIKELKEQYGINNDDANIELINGVLTLVDEPKVEFKFKVGDRVKFVHHNDGLAYEVVKQCLCDGEPAYYIEHNDLVELCYERFLKPFSEDITERIKTFEDAYLWCKKNNVALVEQYHDAINVGLQRAKDILAYLKLRIITCALNEGWEPKFEEDETRYYPYSYTDSDNLGVDFEFTSITFPAKLCFKSGDLATYAAKQFADIYADFCGCKKGGKE